MATRFYADGVMTDLDAVYPDTDSEFPPVRYGSGDDEYSEEMQQEYERTFVADCGQVFDNAVDKYIHAEDCIYCYGM